MQPTAPPRAQLNHSNDDSAEGLPFLVDVHPRKRDISISSVDSEPIQKCQRLESPAHSEDGDRPEQPPVHAEHALHLDVADVDESQVPCDQYEIPLERVSEGHVSVISSVDPHNKILVAESTEGALAMDVGTRVCLSSGEYVGTIASLLGPVTHAYYVVVSSQPRMAELSGKGLVKPLTMLHYDLGHHKVIFDPMGLCDVAKGTDASYINDEELPEHIRPDFSDDEKEMKWKRENKLKNREESISSEESIDEEGVPWSSVRDATAYMQHTDTDLPIDEGNLVVPDWLR